MSSEIFRYFGVIGIVVLWAIGSYVLHKFFETKHKTFSAHVAYNSKALVPWAIGITLNGIFFWLFALLWLTPTFQLSPWFMVVFSITVLSQFITAWVPERPGWMKIVHLYTAYTLGIGMIIAPLFFIASPLVSPIVKAFSGLAISLCNCFPHHLAGNYVLWIALSVIKAL